jgi:hypothetical protein
MLVLTFEILACRFIMSLMKSVERSRQRTLQFVGLNNYARSHMISSSASLSDIQVILLKLVTCIL